MVRHLTWILPWHGAPRSRRRELNDIVAIADIDAPGEARHGTPCFFSSAVIRSTALAPRGSDGLDGASTRLPPMSSLRGAAAEIAWRASPGVADFDDSAWIKAGDGAAGVGRGVGSQPSLKLNQPS